MVGSGVGFGQNVRVRPDPDLATLLLNNTKVIVAVNCFNILDDTV